MLKSARNALAVTLTSVVYPTAGFSLLTRSPKAFLSLLSGIPTIIPVLVLRVSTSGHQPRVVKRKQQPEPGYQRGIRGRLWLGHARHAFLCERTRWNTVFCVVLVVVLTCHSVVVCCLAAQRRNPLAVLGEPPTVRCSVERRACLLLEGGSDIWPVGIENGSRPLLEAGHRLGATFPGRFNLDEFLTLMGAPTVTGLWIPPGPVGRPSVWSGRPRCLTFLLP